MKQAQIFLYREGAKLSQQDIAALREAGLIPVKVARFEDVRVIDPMFTTGGSGDIWMAAIEAIARYGKPDAGSKGPKTLFGEILVEKLSHTTVIGPDGRARGS